MRLRYSVKNARGVPPPVTPIFLPIRLSGVPSIPESTLPIIEIQSTYLALVASLL